MAEAIQAAFDKKEFQAPGPGAMCYMLSKQQYLGDSGGHWHPHLMFFMPLTESSAWGADLPGSPIFGAEDKLNRTDRVPDSGRQVVGWDGGHEGRALNGTQWVQS